MTWEEIRGAARAQFEGTCKACPVCNGLACAGRLPGPGSRGDIAARNYADWQKIHIHLDTICENRTPDLSFSLFGRQFAAPFFAGPVGAVYLHYGSSMDDLAYNQILLPACQKAGICAFTGDGTNPEVLKSAALGIQACGGLGIPTVKPWNLQTLEEKFALVQESGAFAVAMDIDAAGLPFLKGQTPPAGSKSVAQLRQIIDMAGLPFLVKGVMTVRGAQKACEAGAAGIIVSNHGGRVLEGCRSTARALPEIADALRGSGVKILVDGGIRSGADLFRALALGADAALLARPFVTAVYGGGELGVQILAAQLSSELSDVMAMAGVHRIQDIGREHIARDAY